MIDLIRRLNPAASGMVPPTILRQSLRAFLRGNDLAIVIGN
ncbi:MAG TPA: hypothetical protein PKN13_04365 [Accumulibacter sp.]|nr:hypothetical protein [Accumulibacter sp.]HNM74564.1 hypothetical protein [Accumulibacter sp.]